MNCYYCSKEINNVKLTCDNHAVVVIHLLGKDNNMSGIILATTKYEVYLNFEDKNCNIYVRGKREISVNELPGFTPENMLNKIKTYLLLS